MRLVFQANCRRTVSWLGKQCLTTIWDCIKYPGKLGGLFRKWVKRKYRIAHTPAFSERRRNSSMPFLEGRHGFSPKVDKDDIHILTKAQVDFELAQMRGMTAEEAAIVAARAVAEAEAALAEAEEAAREADAAEADAEAAQAFAAAAMKTLKGRSNPKTNGHP